MDTDSAIDIQFIKSKGDKALLLHLHPAFFSFVVVDTSTNEIILCRSKRSDNKAHQISPTALNQWLNEYQSVFNIAFDSVKVAVNSFGFQLVNQPQLATQKSFELLNDFSELTHQLLVNEISETHYIQYAVNKRILKLLKGHFDKKSIYFGDFGLLQTVIHQEQNEDYVLAQILENEVTIAAYKDKSLVFFNKFRIQSQEDLLYYILSVYQNCNLNPSEQVLLLTGLIEAESPMYKLIYDYVRTIKFTAGFNEKTIKDPSFNTSAHYYFNLFNLR